MFSGKTLLITGGTGSFGNAVLKRFLKTDIKEVRIFSRDEKKQDDMRKALKDDKLSFYIGDVRDFSSISAAMGGVDYVFQAAALKQVPSCEFFPMEAVRTNVIGTDNVLTAAVQHGVKKAICLSTDKAVYPINAMGVSRAMTEAELVLYACKHAKPGDIFVQKVPASTRGRQVRQGRGRRPDAPAQLAIAVRLRRTRLRGSPKKVREKQR